MKIEQMEESSIVRSNYKFVFVKFKGSWHSGLLYRLCACPPSPPQQSSPYRIGHALRWACAVLLKSFYGQTLVALAFCLVEKDSGFWTMSSPVCVSHLENGRIGE